MFVEVYLAVKPKSDFLMAAHLWLANKLEWLGFQTSLFVTLTACEVYGNEGWVEGCETHPEGGRLISL